MIILSISNFFIGAFAIFLTIIIYNPINRYKKIKTKEEQLFIQKTRITTVFFIILLLMYFLTLLTIVKDTRFLFLIELFLFNDYIIIVALYSCFMALELYSTYINPVHFFNRLLKQQKYNYMKEFIIFIIGILTVVLDFFLFKLGFYEIKYDEDNIINIKSKISDDDDFNYYCNDSSPFILIGTKWKSFLLIIINFFSLIVYFRIKSKINKFSFKCQHKLISNINKRIIGIFLYFLYGLFYILPIFAGVEITETYNVFGTLFFSLIIINDFAIHIANIASTKFCEYRLRSTLLEYICSYFVKLPKNETPPSLKINASSLIDFSKTENETASAMEILSNKRKDKELVSTYKNGIFIEDYFLGYFDQILNIITSSIFEAYNSSYFSSQANDKNLSDDIKINDISSIGFNQNFTISNVGNTTISSKNEIGDDIINFTITKNKEKDDFLRYKEVFENEIRINNNNNYLNVNLKSYFTPRCVESIYNQKLKGKIIGNSFVSHMILNNNPKIQNFDNPNSYFFSLLASNAKEENFYQLLNTSIKTYDKKYTLDIFDTDDGDISIDNSGQNNQIANLLDKYFTYINAKGIKGTFIPSLVGVFKIKINDFKTLLIFVTKNSLVENSPKNFFTYWQLIRFLNNKPQKLASSKLNLGTLVKDDPIFERSFQIETIKDNPNYNKIFIKNYFEFTEIIKNDLTFLNNIGIQNFGFLLMYYEYENTQKHEKQGVIKIKETIKGAEIIEGTMPEGSLFNDVENLASINSVQGIESLANFNIDGLLVEDNEFGDKNFNKKIPGNMLDVEEKVNISGYEGIFDSFNCLCFFTFENVFDIRKRLSMTSNYYKRFQNKILDNFTEFKK